MANDGAADLKSDALHFHSAPKPGKLEVVATKPLANQRDLALAYSPGVAFPCQAIAADPETAAIYTARQNLVAVLTNGTAVLGLGAIGPLAAKPVMEGKAVLFKKFAGIDVFDIEVAETNVDRLVDIIVALEPTFGGINLEDIKGPECFDVEEKAKARMGIPVFHDDQHGTAIIVSAAVTNALELTGKAIDKVKIVCSGAGAAALASLNLLVSLGAKRENIVVCDIEGVVYKGRETLMDRWKAVYAQETRARTLAEVIAGADIFLGLSAGGVLKPEMLAGMAPDPLVMALANPTPEIMPELALEARPDAMICTGRSDYPNQVNNVLCFPYIFRGALDVGASEINEAMKKAAVAAIAALARETPSEVAAQAYDGQSPLFGKSLAHSEPVRSAADAAHRAGGRARGDGERRRAAADRRLRRLRRPAQPLRLPLRLHDEAAVRQGARGEEARHLFRGRGRARAARDPGRARGTHRPSRADRPPRGDEGPHQALRPDDQPRRRFRGRRSAQRSALPRLCRDLPQGRGPQGRDPRRRAHGRAHLAQRHRRAGAPSRRRRRADLRPRRTLHLAPRPHPRHRRPRARREGFFGALARHRLDRRPISSPTPMCATTRAPRRSPTWRSPAPITCAASASSRRSR